MSLFGISDLHLSLGTNKPMDIFPGWQDYVQKIKKNWKNIVKESDTVVIAGDISWGMDLNEALIDFQFIDQLPGQKFFLKGNHDYWWETKRKMERFFKDNGLNSIRILHNNAAVVNGFSICGTRGWFYDDAKNEDKKVLSREVGRLMMSIDQAEKTGYEPIVFLHYPPVYGDMICQEMMEALYARNIKRCYYGHIHGASAQKAVIGSFAEIEFRLLSCDTTGFCPVLIE